MLDLVGKVTDNGSCCPNISMQTRMIGFVFTVLAGVALLIMSFGAFFGVFLGNVGWFAFLYTLGNLACLSSSFFFVGPKKQWENMLHPKRGTVTLILLASLIMTLVSAFFLAKIFVFIFTAIQFCSLVWYVLSYIPFGQEFCKKSLKSCCCGEEEGDDKREAII